MATQELDRKSGARLLAATRPYTEEDTRLGWRLWINAWICFALFTAGTLAPMPLVLRIACSVFAGLTSVRLFIFYHDFLHGAIFRNSSLAKFIMYIYGVYTLAPPNVWKRSHNYHHQHNAQMATSSIGSYPVLTVEQYETASKWERFMYRFARHPLTILFAYVPAFIIGMGFKTSYKRSHTSHRLGDCTNRPCPRLLSFDSLRRLGSLVHGLSTALTSRLLRRRLSLLYSAQLSGHAATPSQNMGLCFCRTSIFELYGRAEMGALVYGQHWLPPRAPLKL